MKLLSAKEDLKTRTLEKIQGLWAKLLFLAKLRDAKGTYQHWGFLRVHGEKESQIAAHDAHVAVLQQVLRSPIRSLWKEIQDSPRAERQKMAALGPALLPAGSSRAAQSHFNSMLRALAELDRFGEQGSNSPAA